MALLATGDEPPTRSVTEYDNDTVDLHNCTEESLLLDGAHRGPGAEVDDDDGGGSHLSGLTRTENLTGRQQLGHRSPLSLRGHRGHGAQRHAGRGHARRHRLRLIIGPGPDNNLLTFGVLVEAVDANGELVVSRVSGRFECGPG